MKHFSSLIDGLNYVTVCPMCHTPTEISDLDADVMPLPHPYKATPNGKWDGILQFDLYSTDLININIKTGEVELIRDQFISAVDTSQIYSGGTLILKLGIDCNDCCQYNYILQVQVNLNKMIVDRVSLDSETLSIERGSAVYEIKNSYARNETAYYIINRSREHQTQMTSDGMHEMEKLTDTIDKVITLPLFPLDLKNPEDTLQRINKLIVFS